MLAHVAAGILPSRACRMMLLLVCRYPHALFFLELLQSEEFRTALASSQVKVRVVCSLTRCALHWRFAAMYVHISNRLSTAWVVYTHRS